MPAERTGVIRAGVLRFSREIRFHPFPLHMENGNRILVVHPENVA